MPVASVVRHTTGYLTMRVLHVLHNSLPLLCGYSIRSGAIVRHQRQQGLDPIVVTSAAEPESHDRAASITSTASLTFAPARLTKAVAADPARTSADADACSSVSSR